MTERRRQGKWHDAVLIAGMMLPALSGCGEAPPPRAPHGGSVATPPVKDIQVFEERHDEKKEDRADDTAPPDRNDPPSIKTPWTGKEYRVVEVFYATDRKRVVSEKPSEIYGADSSDNLQLGRLEVSIPKGHKLGYLESPSILHFEFHEDPKKHVVLLEVGRPLSEAAWTKGIDNRLNASNEKAALLFIHGFDDTFEFAARRTAQLACDLSLDGVPLMFSWPSQGSESGYPADEDRVMTAVPDLKQVLTLIRKKTQAKVVHVIAHSMGNRVLCNALRGFALEKSDVMMDQVILAAPDVYTDLFRRQLAPEIVKVCKRVSLYASSEDKALMLSMKLHRDPRAGLSGLDRCLVPGIDTIDASTIDTSLIGHGYFAENRTVIDDIFLVLKHQFAPSLRHLVRNGDDPAVYWTFP